MKKKRFIEEQIITLLKEIFHPTSYKMMKILTIILISITMYSCHNVLKPKMENKKYIILEKEKVIEIIKSEGLSLLNSVQLPNGNFMYELKDGSILIDTQGRRKGFLCENMDVVNEFLEKDKFPLKNLRYTYFEEYHDIILQIDNVPLLVSEINKISEKISLPINYTRKDLSELLDSLREELSIKENRYFNLLFIALLGNDIAKRKNLVWKYEKKYAEYNPYYEPILVDKNGFMVKLYVIATFVSYGNYTLDYNESFLERTQYKVHVDLIESFNNYHILFNLDLTEYRYGIE